MCAVVEALVEGEISRLGTLKPLVQRHLDRCAACRRRVERLLGPDWRSDEAAPRRPAEPLQRPPTPRPQPLRDEELDRICHRVTAQLWTGQASPDRERVDAGRELLELLALPTTERFGLVEASPHRFRSPALVDLLLEESRTAVPEDPQSAFDLAGLAQQICLRLDERRVPLPMVMDSVVLARAIRADALRATGDLSGAHTRYRRLEPLLGQGTQDPMVLAEVDERLAALRRDQRRLADADECLERAGQLYRGVGDGARLGQVLVERSRLAYRRLDLDGALDLLEQARHQLSPVTEGGLGLILGHSEALYLLEAERADEALGVFELHRPLYLEIGDRFPGFAVCYPWLEGRIQLTLGHPDQAVGHLEQAHQALQSEADPYEHALLSLDLAQALAAVGRVEDLKRLLATLPSDRQTLTFDDELLAALMLFRRGLVDASLDPAATRELRRLLHLMRYSLPAEERQPS